MAAAAVDDREDCGDGFAGGVAALWRLIYQGLGARDDALARKRALHCLQRIVDSAQPPRSAASPRDAALRRLVIADDEGTGPEETLEHVQHWHAFCTAFAILEQESVVHLTEQVLPALTQLCSRLVVRGEAAPRRSTLEPALTFEWFSLLLGAALDNENPSVRKRMLLEILTAPDREHGTGGGVGLPLPLDVFDARWCAATLFFGRLR